MTARPALTGSGKLMVLSALALACGLGALALPALVRVTRFKTMLGPWHLTMEDGHGHTIGLGTIELDVSGWQMRWGWRPPFIVATPQLTVRSSALSLTEAGVGLLGDKGGDMLREDEWRFARPDPSTDRSLNLYFATMHGDERNLVMNTTFSGAGATGTLEGFHQDISWVVPGVVHWSREAPAAR